MEEVQTWFYLTGHNNFISLYNHIAILGWSQRA